MNRKLTITAIIVLVIFILGILGALAWFFIYEKPFEKEEKEPEAIITEEEEEDLEEVGSWENSYIYWAQQRSESDPPTYAIYRMWGDGSEPELMFENDLAVNSIEGISISPDGDKIAYACSKDGLDICLRDGNGENLLNLQIKEESHQVAWSPDGQKLAFASQKKDNEKSKSRIATINPDGSGYQELSNQEDAFDEYYPSYSQDGKKILFQVRKENGNRDILIMDADGKNVVELIAGEDNEYEPTFSPDNKKIIYTKTEEGVDNIWVADADGSNQQKLTEKGSNKSPRVSPDGQKIAFISNQDDQKTWEVYLMNIDGSQPERLTNNNIDDYAPRWSIFKIEGLGVEHKNAAEVLHTFLASRMRGEAEAVRKLAGGDLADEYPKNLQLLSGKFNSYQIENEEEIDAKTRKYNIALYSQDLEEGENIMYTLILEGQKWLVSVEEPAEIEEENDEEKVEEIKTGAVEYQREDLENIQKMVDEGEELWRTDPYMVATNEGEKFGFNKSKDSFTLVSKVEMGEYSGAGEATVETIHGGITYIIQLIQPLKQGDDGIWSINSIVAK